MSDRKEERGYSGMGYNKEGFDHIPWIEYQRGTGNTTKPKQLFLYDHILAKSWCAGVNIPKATLNL